MEGMLLLTVPGVFDACQKAASCKVDGGFSPSTPGSS